MDTAEILYERYTTLKTENYENSSCAVSQK